MYAINYELPNGTEMYKRVKKYTKAQKFAKEIKKLYDVQPSIVWYKTVRMPNGQTKH